MSAYEVIGILIGGTGTLAVYSFLFSENRFYRIFEHLFVGVGAGFGVVETFRSLLIPKLFEPVWYKGICGLAFRLQTEWLTDNAGPLGAFVHRVAVESWQPRQFLWLIPAAFGSLYYAIYSRRFNWLARMVIGFGIGASGGAAFEGFFSEFLPQIFAAFRPIVVFESGGVNWGLSLLNVLISLTMISTMAYFIFTIDRRRIYLERTASAGRLLMMVSFGAIFGSTVTARLALLIERVRFLREDWFGLIVAGWDKVFHLVFPGGIP